MAPVVPFLGLIGTVIGAGATIATAVMSNRQAEKSAARQAEYQQKLLDQQTATAAEEKRLTDESNQRNRAYGASLLQGNSQLDNILTGSWDDEEEIGGGSTLLGETLQPMSVQSMFA